MGTAKLTEDERINREMCMATCILFTSTFFFKHNQKLMFKAVCMPKAFLMKQGVLVLF